VDGLELSMSKRADDERVEVVVMVEEPLEVAEGG
jgi:hypothetical protein